MKTPVIIIIFLFLIACNENNELSHTGQHLTDSFQKPHTFTPGKDTLKLPTIINVPLIVGGSKQKQALIHPLDSLSPHGKPYFNTFNTDQGLVLDAVICSKMDSKGNIWFGTDGGGASRYDGKTFTNFTTTQGLINNTIRYILEDKNGNIWFSSSAEGLSRYDGKTFTNFTTTQGLASNSVIAMTQDSKGNIWFGTAGEGVSRYDGKTFVTITTEQGLAHNNVWSILEDKNGNIWFGTYGGGASRYDGKNFTNYTTNQGLINNVVASIIEDKTGDIWFGTKGGTSRYDGKTFTNFNTTQGLVNNDVRNIIEDKRGNIWFATARGISRYDGAFTNFTTEQGLTNNNVWCVTEDKTGNIWFGTYGGGVSQYNGEAFMNFTIAQGLGNTTVWSVGEDKNGNMWFGTYGGGVSRYDGKTFTNYTKEHGLANNSVWSMTNDKTGNMWFGTSGGGVSRYDGKTFTNFTVEHGLASNWVWSILEDKKGNMWFGTEEGGVSKYDGKTFTNYTTEQGLAHNDVWSIIEDRKGNIWFGTYGGGVSRYDGKTFTNYTTEQGLANNNIWSIKEDKLGNIWIGTAGGGVSLYNEKSVMNYSSKSVVKFFTNFTVENGLPDNVVTQVVELNNGKMLIGTNLGICELNLDEKTGQYNVERTYNTSTGYPVKDVNAGQNAMFKDSRGIVWIGTGSDKTGLVRFNPSVLNLNNYAPKVVIQKVKLNEENVCWLNLKIKDQKSYRDSLGMLLAQHHTFGKTVSQEILDTQQTKFKEVQFDGITAFYPIPEKLVLPYKFNHISFDFNAVELSRPNLVKYQYKLDGADKDWSPITNKTDVSYTNLWEGSYTFKVKAIYIGPSIGKGKDWSEPVNYTFKVLPPWYRTWWMYSAYVLSLVFFILMLVWGNGRRLQAKASELEEEVRKATLEIIEQKKIVEEKHEEIIASIRYARRIQDALLTSQSYIERNIKRLKGN